MEAEHEPARRGRAHARTVGRHVEQDASRAHHHSDRDEAQRMEVRAARQPGVRPDGRPPGPRADADPRVGPSPDVEEARPWRDSLEVICQSAAICAGTLEQRFHKANLALDFSPNFLA